MHILLPPSEGKTPPRQGPPLDLGSLSFWALSATRTAVLEALVGLCRADPQEALRVLGLGPGLAAEAARNASLPTEPCAPAWQVYSGVLYTCADIAGLPTSAFPDRLVIASALFGLMRHDDAIPAYRLSGAVRLPGLPSPRSLWRAPVGGVVESLAQQGLVVDMRSQTYAWGPAAPPQVVGIRVMTVRGGRTVPVSHHNKAAKGRIARDLVTAADVPATGQELVDLLRGAGWDARPGQGPVVDVLQPDPASAVAGKAAHA